MSEFLDRLAAYARRQTQRPLQRAAMQRELRRLGADTVNADRGQVRDGRLIFRCNICGGLNLAALSSITREAASCLHCASTLRLRSIVQGLSLALFGRSLAVPDFPHSPHMAGWGLSDAPVLARALAQRLGYRNTYYDRAPRLDIQAPDPADSGSLDFLIASDVFEHVPPPIDRALANAHRLLKPGGAFILSVPYTLQGATVEHFPKLADFSIVKRGGQRLLLNRLPDGSTETFEDLCFHGGPGLTLEMRVFSKPDLIAGLQDAGFRDVRFLHEPCLEHGIHWPVDAPENGLPLLARA